jgi:hypothetical protein
MRFAVQADVTLEDGRVFSVGYLLDDEGPELDTICVYGSDPVSETDLLEITDIVSALADEAHYA